MYTTKMRLQMFDPSTKELVSDRLVEQATEFNIGPKFKHEGPLRIELSLLDKQDVDNAINYIGKLVGNLPLETKVAKKLSKNKAAEQTLMSDEPLREFMELCCTKQSQEDLISHLREHDFRFLTYQDLMDLPTGVPNIKAKHNDYQFMVRLVKQAKVPINDRWDTRLVFGIKYLGERRNLVQVYIWGELDKKVKMPWVTAATKEINFKDKPKVFFFPEYMTLEERGRFRAEHRKLNGQLESERSPSKFFTRWAQFIPGSQNFG